MNQNGVFGKMVWDPDNANGEQEIRTEIKRLTYENGRESESQVVSYRVITAFTFSLSAWLNRQVQPKLNISKDNADIISTETVYAIE